MMIGEHHRSNPTVHIPPWPNHDDPTSEIYSSYFPDDSNAGAGDYSPYYLREAMAALQRYLPSNEFDAVDGDSDSESPADSPVDAFTCDHFRMYEFKIRRCARGRSHDWTECPYAHPGEKARRRDPRKFHYSGTACPDFRKGNCKKGDACEYAHGVFECWLHPARYRTQPCKDGTSCRRRVCFFAHTPEQIRLNVSSPPPRSLNSPDSYDGSPLRQMVLPLPFMSSPVSTTPPESPSPPMSPMAQSLSKSLGSSSINEMVASLRNLQLGKLKSIPSMPVNRNISIGSGYGSPRGSVLRPGFCSLPTTPTQVTGPGSGRVGYLDLWDQSCEEEPMMERVESGRDIRAKMFEKLSKENSLKNSDSGQPDGAPDVGWITDLVN